MLHACLALLLAFSALLQSSCTLASLTSTVKGMDPTGQYAYAPKTGAKTATTVAIGSGASITCSQQGAGAAPTTATVSHPRAVRSTGPALFTAYV